jgi:hypothetical protein
LPMPDGSILPTSDLRKVDLPERLPRTALAQVIAKPV